MQPATNKAVLLIAFAINPSPRLRAVVVVWSALPCMWLRIPTQLRLFDPHAYEAHTDLITLLLKQSTSHCIHPTVPLQMHEKSKLVTTPAAFPRLNRHLKDGFSDKQPFQSKQRHTQWYTLHYTNQPLRVHALVD